MSYAQSQTPDAAMPRRPGRNSRTRLFARPSDYNRSDLSRDITAGLTTAVLLVPQGMAYAALAGLPPIIGLYASTVSLLVYGLFGTSRELAVGPVAVMSLMTATSVGAIAKAGSDAYLSYAILLAGMVGVLQLVLGLVRGGFLVNFLSHPVISGFTSAAAILIGVSQLGSILGIKDLKTSGAVYESVWQVLQRVGEIHTPTLLIGLAVLALLVVGRRVNPRFPAPLVAVVLGTGMVSWLGASSLGVSIVGKIPAGFPKPALPSFDLEAFKALVPAAITIALVGFMESISVAKAFARRARYEVQPDRELVALGAANLAAGLFQGFPVTGGFSRTAVNAQAGARSGIASMVTAAAVILVLLLLTPLFHNLPRAVLAAIILSAVAGLVDVKEVRHLWRVQRSDLALLGITFVGTLVLGIKIGLLTGIISSLLWFVIRSTRPHAAVLGRVPGTSAWRNVKNYPEAKTIPGTLALRIDAELYFGNAAFLKSLIADQEEVAAASGNTPRVIVLDMSSVGHLDSSADGALHEVAEELTRRGIPLLLANVKQPVRLVMEASHLVDVVGRGRFFLDIEDAMTAAEAIAEEAARKESRGGSGGGVVPFRSSGLTAEGRA